MVAEKKIFFFFFIMSIGANDPWGMANLDLRGMVGRMYVGDYLTSLHTLSISSRPHSFIEDFLTFFSYIALYKHMTPGA